MLCRPCCCDAGMSEVWPFLQRWRGAHSTVGAIFDGAVLQVFAKDGQEDSTSLKPWHAPKHSRIAFTGLARATLNSHVKLYKHYIISMCLQTACESLLRCLSSFSVSSMPWRPASMTHGASWPGTFSRQFWPASVQHNDRAQSSQPKSDAQPPRHYASVVNYPARLALRHVSRRRGCCWALAVISRAWLPELGRKRAAQFWGSWNLHWRRSLK